MVQSSTIVKLEHLTQNKLVISDLLSQQIIVSSFQYLELHSMVGANIFSFYTSQWYIRVKFYSYD